MDISIIIRNRNHKAKTPPTLRRVLTRNTRREQRLPAVPPNIHTLTVGYFAAPQKNRAPPSRQFKPRNTRTEGSSDVKSTSNSLLEARQKRRVSCQYQHYCVSISSICRISARISSPTSYKSFSDTNARGVMMTSSSVRRFSFFVVPNSGPIKGN